MKLNYSISTPVIHFEAISIGKMNGFLQLNILEALPRGMPHFRAAEYSALALLCGREPGNAGKLVVRSLVHPISSKNHCLNRENMGNLWLSIDYLLNLNFGVPYFQANIFGV